MEIKTKPQQELIKILIDKRDMSLGEISQKYYANKPDNKRLSNVMRRNSHMSAWLNRLYDKGLVIISYYGDVTYNATTKAKDLFSSVANTKKRNVLML